MNRTVPAALFHTLLCPFFRLVFRVSYFLSSISTKCYYHFVIGIAQTRPHCHLLLV